MVIRSLRRSFVMLRKQSSRKKTTTNDDNDDDLLLLLLLEKAEVASLNGSDTEESNDGSSSSSTSERKSVRFLTNADGDDELMLEIHSYPNAQERTPREDLFWTSSEMQNIQAEHLDFAKDYWKQNSEYVECLESLFRQEKSYLTQSSIVNSLIRSPVRGLEHQMTSVFRIQRRWMQERILALQAEHTGGSSSSSLSSTEAEWMNLRSEVSQSISRPSREFALKMALGDAQLAEEYQKSPCHEDNSDCFASLPLLEGSDLSFEESSSFFDI